MIQADHLQAIREEMAGGNFSRAASQCLTLLRERPRDIAAIELYGSIAIELGRVADAIIVFQKLLKLEPEHGHAHDRLASLYFTQGNHQQAKAHARAALGINPRLIASYIVAGSILLEEKKESEALETFAIARKVSPGNLDIEQSYIHALQLNGHFDQASQALREAISAHPDAPTLHLMLANSRKLSAEDSDTALIRSLLDEDGRLQPRLAENKETEASAHLALFKVESDLENHATAFAHLKAAKDIRKQQFSYDPDMRDGSVSLVGKIFTESFFAERAGLGCTAPDPIFVIGMPRSGTTLLERVIANHNEVEAAGELPHIPRMAQELCAKYGGDQYDLTGFRRAPEHVWKELGEEYLRRARANIPANLYFVDKLPGNFYYLGFIKTILPNAKIVHISRHPMATCLSIYEQDFRAKHGYSNDLRATGLVYLDYTELMDYWRNAFGASLIEISYEELVADPGNSASWLFARLGLDDDQGDIRNTQGKGTIRTASQWQARQPIHAQSVDRWQKLRQQLQPLEEILAPLLQSQRT